MKSDYLALRTKMVEEQLIPRGIEDKNVLSALRKIPREKFIPQKYLDLSYGDFPVTIGNKQTISQPYIVALMIQCLQLKPEENILEIGTGSGYQTAILAELTTCVYSLERIGILADEARQKLKDLGYQNVKIDTADGSCGWRKFAPYDKIIVSAATAQIPQPLAEQLKEGGSLIAPIGGTFSQVLTLATKLGGKLQTEQICDCAFVPLLGKHS